MSQSIAFGSGSDSGSFGATLSMFELTLPFGIYEAFDDPDTAGDDLVFRADGEQRNRGVELSIYGEPLGHLRVLGGLTLLDAEMTRTQDGAVQGRTAVGSPDAQANVNVEWEGAAVPGLPLGVRAMYTS